MPPARTTASIRELRAFVTAVDLGSVGRAAARLGITQPSLSKRLRSLEEFAHTPLLRRSASGVEPTAAGQRLLEAARRVVAEADTLDAVMASLSETREPLRVAASPAFAELVVPAAIASFGAGEHPRPIELTVANSPVVRAIVARGDTDVGVAAAPLGEDLAADGHVLLLEDEVVVVLEPEDPWTALDAVPAAELGRRGLVVRDPAAQIRATIAEGLAAAGVSLAEPASELGSPAAVKAAIHGQGTPGLLSRYAVDPARDRLEVRPVAGADLRRRCWALLAPSADPVARTFAGHLRDTAAAVAAARR